MVTGSAAAQEPATDPRPHRVDLRGFGEIHALEVAWVVGAGALSLAAPLILSPPDTAVSGPIGPDAGVQRLLIADSARARKTANLLSDVLWHTVQWYPLVIEALVLTAIADDNPSAALKLAVAGLEAMATAGVLTVAAQNLVARRRPHDPACGRDPECVEVGDNRSFYSGHTAMAMTGAMLTCLNHGYLEMYDPEEAGAVACGLSVAGTVLAGALRVSANRHWFSDVVAGTAVGALSGALLPWLLHYRGLGGAAGRAKLMPWTDGTALGVGATGLF